MGKKLALSFDKELILETVSKKKDQIALGLLSAVLLIGGWFMYQQIARSSDEIIRDAYGAGGKKGDTAAAGTTLAAEEVVSKLLTKRTSEQYDVKQRSPFGSPEEQLRARQEIDAAYQRGVELFQSGQYEAAIQQFDKLFLLDVTETRVQYPVLPSEYKRRAVRENAKKNLDRILQAAQLDIQEGDRLAGQGKNQEALTVYVRADKSVSDVIASDTEGNAFGAQNLDKMKQLQQQAQTKTKNLQKSTLLQELNQGVSKATQNLAGNNYIDILVSWNTLLGIQTQLTSLDPNFQLVGQNERNRLNGLIQQVSLKLQGSFAELIAQADQQFTQAMQQQDLQKTAQAILALRQASGFAATNKDFNQQELKKKIDDYTTRRAELVVQMGNQFYQQQKQNLDKKQYNQFDLVTRNKYLNELLTLKEPGSAISAAVRTQVTTLENQLKSLRVPESVDKALSISAVSATNAGYKVEYLDKSSKTATPKKKEVVLREGRKDYQSGLTLTQVDTANGFVILSHPEYMDAKVRIGSATN